MGKFQKGHKRLGGKVVGSKNKKTLLWENLGDYFTQAGAKRAMKIMASCKDKEFMIYYKDLIELFKPKLARTELVGDPNQPVEVKVTRTIVTKQIDHKPKP